MNAMQCRMARAALKLSARKLAEGANVGEATVARFERGDVEPNQGTLSAIQRALEAAGVEFIERGVRLRADTLDTIEGGKINGLGGTTSDPK